MRKMMMFALMLAASPVAFAQDAVKEVLKAKTYADAQALVKSNLASMSDADKAKAYNKLVDLSFEKISKEQSVITANQMAEQFKQGKVQPYDTLGFYNALADALTNAVECEKYDQMPNEKGKVKPKFHSANQNRLYNLRVYLVNAGQEAAQKNNSAGVLKYWGLYSTTADTPLFADVANKQPDQYVSQVAGFAARYAIQDKDFAAADKYIDVSLKHAAANSDDYKDALSLKFYVAQQQLKTKEDSLAYINKLKEFYAKDTSNDMIMGTLANMYGNMNMKDELKSLVNSRLAADPNSAMAWTLKGQAEMNANQWDEAIASFKKAIALDDKNVVVLTYLGFCINSKAAAINGDVPAQKALYKESMGYLEQAKELDPNREKANWSYPLYQCYYVNYGAADQRTKDLESLLNK
jgi:hypothetical protein